MAIDDHDAQKERKPVPPLGTPEFEEHYERTGQTAMDATLAHPISRVVFGLLTISLAWIWLEVLREAVTEYSVVWGILSVIAWTIIFGRLIREVGPIAIYGTSRSRWFVALARRCRSTAKDK